jgi:hypothetical protein
MESGDHIAPCNVEISQAAGSRLAECACPYCATYFLFLHKTQDSRGLSRRRLRRERKRLPRSIPEAIGGSVGEAIRITWTLGHTYRILGAPEALKQ